MNPKDSRKSLLSSPPLSRNAYAELKQRILRLHYPPGENLLEENLQKELNISRTPIRMALSRLEQEGLVLHRPGRGYFICDLRLDEIRSLYQVREFLEGPATAIATQMASTEELENFCTFIRKMDSALNHGEFDNYLDQAVEFHYRIALMTKNEILCGMVRTLNEKLLIVSRILLRSEKKIIQSHVEHHRIVDLMLKRNAAGAGRLARKHVLKSSERQFQLLKSKAELLALSLPRGGSLVDPA